MSRWSLFHLPAEFQQAFRILILVPIGALLICVLRNIVGFPTFGIFMPTLMAIAFRSTGLLHGLAIFTTIIGLGYYFRSKLDQLRLLLVPRLYTWMGLAFLFPAIFPVIDLSRLVLFIGGSILWKEILCLYPLRPFLLPLVFALTAGTYGSFEARNIRLERITVKSPKIPREAGRIRIVQITDVHLGKK